MNPKIIAFDADDTLWHNEPYFDEAQAKFCELFADYASNQEILQLILKKAKWKEKITPYN
jgi:putative hydrolase of the HAD superfamily